MVRVIIHEFDLRLRHTFTISRESIDVQPTMIVELRDGDLRGFGEATANRFYDASISQMRAAVESVRDIVENTAWDEPGDLWNKLAAIPISPFPLCAIDEAAHDLWGKRHALPVYKLWGLEPEPRPLTNYTIGIDSIEQMVAKMSEYPDWPLFKVKLGTDHDLQIVEALREHTDATFRVDANCGWTAKQTIDNAPRLQELGVEFIEQPLPLQKVDQMAEVREACCLPLIADESCQVEEDVERCQAGFDGINIKLVKCGGLTPARRMIAQAKQLGLKVMVGCMTESSVGIGSIAQLLPLLDYVDMDGQLLLTEDIAAGYQIVGGDCLLSDAPGCGVELL